IPERALVGHLELVDVALEDDLGVGGHVDADRLRAHQLDRLAAEEAGEHELVDVLDRKSTRLNSSHRTISYAVFCLKKKKQITSPYSEPPSILLILEPATA